MSDYSGEAPHAFNIRKTVYEALREHCWQAKPIEACGFLSGKELWHGDTLWAVENEAHSPARFLISEAAVASVLRAIAERGERLTGLYHSHPTARAIPSARDLAYHPYPDLPYFIFSLVKKEGELCGYLINKKRIEELNIAVIDE
ncbi:M67 family metallopeptidase [Aneurinibacillus sp. BA2021]|nr:M67 family metallopeptidase [Aneurinibacillus sp. BA2021]